MHFFNGGADVVESQRTITVIVGEVYHGVRINQIQRLEGGRCVGDLNVLDVAQEGRCNAANNLRIQRVNCLLTRQLVKRIQGLTTEVIERTVKILSGCDVDVRSE